MRREAAHAKMVSGITQGMPNTGQAHLLGHVYPYKANFAYPPKKVYSTEALLGFQGRGLDKVVQLDLCHDLFLKDLMFQWP